MKKTPIVKVIFTSSSLLLLTSINVQANEVGWFFKPAVGAGYLSDKSVEPSQSSNLNGLLNIETSGGVSAGLGFGYQLTESLSTEIFWEYRANDTESTLSASNDTFTGDITANIIYANVYYHFFANNEWHPYLGAGIAWAPTIEVQLENPSANRSFSSDGDIGFQFMLGADYRLSNKWHLNAEGRYGFINSVSLEGENSTVGALNELDYTPFTFSVGFTYTF
jgi:outer membrane protein W